MTEQQIAAVDVAAVLRFLGPADRPAIAAEQRVLPQRLDIDVLRNIRKRRDEQRVLGAIEFAQVTGLTVSLARDDRNSIGLVEHVGRAHVHANIAGRTALGIDELSRARNTSSAVAASACEASLQSASSLSSAPPSRPASRK